MSSKADERAERVALLALVFRRLSPEANDYRCFDAARQLVKLADRMKAEAERYCNTGDEERYDRRASKAGGTIAELVGQFGIRGMAWEVQGDPRGSVVKLTHPKINGNGWSGQTTWSV